MKQTVFLFLFIPILITNGLYGEPSTSWAEKTLQSMSNEEKIGQLLMVAAYIDADYAEREIGNLKIIQEMDNYIKEFHLGGLAYVGPSWIAKQVTLTNHYQEISKYPLLIAQDLEWGLAMRIQDGMKFPKNITLGAIKDNTLIYKMGLEVGRQARLVGVHMNFSPVLDVNIEPENMAINVRSFGDSPREVAAKGVAMIRGLQDAGIIASAKHFPGLGDIQNDPHLGLPIHSHARKRLDEVELYPFVQAIKAGVLSIQTEHVVVSALEKEQNAKLPASLSPLIVNELLKKELNFKGLVLSGALRMKALVKHFSNAEIVLKAFMAGSDMLLMPEDVSKAYQTLKLALEQGQISQQDVNERVLKILKLKERVGLNEKRLVTMPSQQELETPEALALKALLFKQAVRIVNNKNELIPLDPAIEKVAYIQIGECSSSPCFERLSKELNVDFFSLSLDHDNVEEQESLVQRLTVYPLVIVALHPADPRRIEQIRLLNATKQKEELMHFRVHGVPQSLIGLIARLHAHHEKSIMLFFGNPFGLSFVKDYANLVMGYEIDVDAQKAIIDILLEDYFYLCENQLIYRNAFKHQNFDQEVP